jgi:hypothetical protein
MVKSLKCSEPISLVKSHNDLSMWTTPHFCISENTFTIFNYAMNFKTNQMKESNERKN